MCKQAMFLQLFGRFNLACPNLIEGTRSAPIGESDKHGCVLPLRFDGSPEGLV
jgi:hypothetical protein